MAIGDIVRGVLSSGGTHGEAISSWGGPLCVANGDAKTLSNNVDDPWSACIGAHASDADIYPIICGDRGAYLDLYHIYTHTADITVTTEPQIRVFGLTPDPKDSGISDSPGQAQSLWPHHIDSDFPSPRDTTASTELVSLPNDFRGWWIPLEDPDNTDDFLEFTGVPHHYSGTTRKVYVSKKQTVYIAGCTMALVTINRAAVYSNAAGKGVIAARIVG